ncbi:MAG: tetratricopeptide repeat protein [Flavobacteriales bacterium]|nr:tetratricopeptide repeat protein [Flavobacteriales bacterium]
MQRRPTLCLTVALILISDPGWSQKADLDSLWSVWNARTSPVGERLKAMTDIVWYGYRQTDPDSALLLSQVEYDLAVQAKEPVWQASSLNAMGTVHKNKGEYPEAIALLERSFAILDSIGKKKGAAGVLNNIANIYGLQGANARAIDYYAQSLTKYAAIGDSVGMATTFMNMAKVHAEEKETHQAIVYYKKGLAIMERKGERASLALGLNNLGTAYEGLRQYDSALVCLQRSMAVRDSIGDAWGTAMAHYSIGTVHYHQNDLSSAIDEYQHSMTLWSGMGDRWGQAHALNGLGMVYLDMGRPEKAAWAGEQALRYADDMNSKVEANQLLYHAYKITGRAAKALQSHETWIRLRDSIESGANQRAVIHQQYAYRYEKQALADSLEHANALAHVENERRIEHLNAERDRGRALAITVGAALILAGGSVFYRVDRKRRSAVFERDQARSESATLRAQMNPHFIFNALQSVNDHLGAGDAEKARTLVVRLSRVMRKVLNNSVQGEVSLKDDLAVVVEYMEAERLRTQDKFRFELEVAADIDTEAVHIPPLVYEPFLENAIWHGIGPKEGTGVVHMKIWREKDDLYCTIHDDGVGRDPEGKGPGTGKGSHGTAITRSRLELLERQTGRQARFEYLPSDVGTLVRIILPIT